MYKLLRNLLFLFPPEAVHHFSMKVLSLFFKIHFLKRIMGSPFSQAGKQYPELARNLWGLGFRNPLGLGAGFDKNALYLNELEALGFGFLEIGTVTPLAQSGNEKPRLFRLPKDQALINRMGFNNDGVKKVAERLRNWNQSRQQPGPAGQGFLIGGNIGKNKNTPNDQAWKDYEICLLELWDCVDYFVVNLSSPNTPGLRELQEKNSLRKILTHLQELNEKQVEIRSGKRKPLLLKISPDLDWTQLDEIIDLVLEIKLDGIVASNTSLSREGLRSSSELVQKMAGGLSGLPLKRRSTEIIDYIHRRTGVGLPIIASGGVFTAADAKEKIRAGASLVQVWTGFIYEGPGIVKAILNDLI
jgi:dihydroorotate dehydrogenase